MVRFEVTVLVLLLAGCAAAFSPQPALAPALRHNNGHVCMAKGRKRAAVKKFFTETLLRRKPDQIQEVVVDDVQEQEETEVAPFDLSLFDKIRDARIASLTSRLEDGSIQSSSSSSSPSSSLPKAKLEALEVNKKQWGIGATQAPPPASGKPVSKAKLAAVEVNQRQWGIGGGGAATQAPPPASGKPVSKAKLAAVEVNQRQWGIGGGGAAEQEGGEKGGSEEKEEDYVTAALRERTAEGLLAAGKRAEQDGRKLEAANCLVSYLRIETDGNLLRVAKDEAKEAKHKKLWDEHAPSAAKLAEEVLATDPQNAMALAVFAEARTMQAAAKGLVQVATSGDLPVLQQAVKDLREVAPEYDMGLAWVFASSNYLGLPWPLKSAKKAQDRANEALKVCGNSARNLYVAALVERELGNARQAAELFHKVKAESKEPKSASERDIVAFLAEQAELGLKECLATA